GLSLTGLPAGATPSFTPANGSAAGFGSTLVVSTASVAPGTYSLTLGGTDSRPSIGGERTSSLSLTVLTPSQALQTLIIPAVNALHTGGTLNGGQTNSLLTKINHAISNLGSKSSPNSACGDLTAFVNEVNSYVSAGILTPAQASSLLNGPLGVIAIMASIP